MSEQGFKIFFSKSDSRIRVHFSGKLCLVESRPPAVFLDEATDKMNAEVSAGNIQQYHLYDKQISYIWSFVRNHMSPEQAENINLQVILAQGGPRLSGVILSQPTHSKYLFQISIDPDCATYHDWSISDFHLDILVKSRSLCDDGLANTAQIDACFYKLQSGMPIKDIPVTAFPKNVLELSKPWKIILNKARGEVSIHVNDLCIFWDQALLDTMIIACENTIVHLNATGSARWNFFGEHLLNAIEIAKEGLIAPWNTMIGLQDQSEFSYSLPKHKSNLMARQRVQSDYEALLLKDLTLSQDYRFEEKPFFHDGNLVIKGDVKHPGEILVTGDLTVNGDIGMTIITVGGNLSVQGRISANNKGRIFVGKKVEVGSVQDSTLVCGNSAVVKNDIINSTIISGDSIRVIDHNGTMCGGKLIATKSIITSYLGSMTGDRTLCYVGVNWGVQLSVLVGGERNHNTVEFEYYIRRRLLKSRLKYAGEQLVSDINGQDRSESQFFLKSKAKTKLLFSKNKIQHNNPYISVTKNLYSNVALKIGTVKVPISKNYSNVRINAKHFSKIYIRSMNTSAEQEGEREFRSKLGLAKI